MSCIKKTFQWVFFSYKSDLNETFNESLTDFNSMNCLTILQVYIAHQMKPIYRLSNKSKIFTKFNKHGLYSTPIA